MGVVCYDPKIFAGYVLAWYNLGQAGAALGIGKVARRVVERSVGHVLAVLAQDLTGMRARRGLGLRQLSWFEVVRTVGSE